MNMQFQRPWWAKIPVLCGLIIANVVVFYGLCNQYLESSWVDAIEAADKPIVSAGASQKSDSASNEFAATTATPATIIQDATEKTFNQEAKTKRTIARARRESLKRDPRYVRLDLMQVRMSVDQHYSYLLRKLALDEEKRDRLISILCEKEIGLISPNSNQPGNADAARIGESIHQLIGDEGYKTYCDYESHVHEWSTINDIRRQLMLEGAPLSDKAVDDLADALIRTSTSGESRFSDAFMLSAQASLSASQSEVLSRIKAERDVLQRMQDYATSYRNSVVK
jgi:hypothetical protein